jgi:hypothetical protein
MNNYKAVFSSVSRLLIVKKYEHCIENIYSIFRSNCSLQFISLFNAVIYSTLCWALNLVFLPLMIVWVEVIMLTYFEELVEAGFVVRQLDLQKTLRMVFDFAVLAVMIVD